jgi:P pilus assembly chaperone PapD
MAESALSGDSPIRPRRSDSGAYPVGVVRRFLILIVALSALAAAESAAGAVVISRISFDSPGRDTGSNASLNAEWIRIANTGHSRVALTGWRIRDASGKRYVFGTLSLGAGQSVTLHTGSGPDSARHRYWRQENYVWNNSGDTATLRNRRGAVVDRCSYRSNADSPFNC